MAPAEPLRRPMRWFKEIKGKGGEAVANYDSVTPRKAARTS